MGISWGRELNEILIQIRDITGIFTVMVIFIVMAFHFLHLSSVNAIFLSCPYTLTTKTMPVSPKWNACSNRTLIFLKSQCSLTKALSKRPKPPEWWWSRLIWQMLSILTNLVRASDKCIPICWWMYMRGPWNSDIQYVTWSKKGRNSITVLVIS